MCGDAIACAQCKTESGQERRARVVQTAATTGAQRQSGAVEADLEVAEEVFARTERFG